MLAVIQKRDIDAYWELFFRQLTNSAVDHEDRLAHHLRCKLQDRAMSVTDDGIENEFLAISHKLSPID